MAPEQSAMGLPVRELDHLACVADEPALIQAAVDHLGPPLRAGRPAVVLATGEHLARLEEQLADAGVDLPASAFARWNADVVLAAAMGEPSSDGSRLEQTLGELVEGLTAGGRVLACYEELAGLLWEQGRLPAAIELAEAWNRLAGLHGLAVVSGYPAGLLAGATEPSGMASLWAKHTWVLEAPGLREPEPGGAARQPGADTAPAGPGSGSAGGPAAREESSGGHRDSPEEEKGKARDRLARRLERKTATLERVQQANQALVEELRATHARIRELKGENRQLRAANQQLHEQVTEADEAGPADGLGPAAG